MRVFFLLIDGVGDCQAKCLGGKTPLEAASHPKIDSIVSDGWTGIYDPVAPGKACGTDTAHFNIHGFPPDTYYRGRGALEALGQGIDLGPTDVAFKSNFAYIDDKTDVVVSRRADRDFTREGPILCEYLDGMEVPGFPEVHITVRYATEHRCTISMSSPKLSDAVTGTDPLVDERPLIESEPTADTEEARYTARLINALSDEIRRRLKGHPINAERIAAGKTPANLILLRGPSSTGANPSYEERTGMKEEAMVPTGIVRGIMRQLGIPLLPLPPGATGDEHTDIRAKILAAAQHLCEADAPDIVFCHYKAADDASHDGRAEDKVRHIEACDAALGEVLPMLRAIPGGCCVVITGDHSTPCNFFDHSDEPVPFALCPLNGADLFPGFKTGNAARFTEAECCKGDLTRFKGEHIVRLLKHVVKQ